MTLLQLTTNINSNINQRGNDYRGEIVASPHRLLPKNSSSRHLSIREMALLVRFRRFGSIGVCQRFQVRNDRSLFFFGQSEVSYDEGYSDGVEYTPARASSCLPMHPFPSGDSGGHRVTPNEYSRREIPYGSRVVKMNDALQALEPTVVGVRLDKTFVGPLVHVAQGRGPCAVP